MIIYLYVNFHVLRCLEIQRRFGWFRIVQGPFRTLVGAAPGSSALDRGCWNETTQQWLNNSNNELVISEMYSNYFKCSQKLMKYHVSKRIRKGVRTKTFRSDSQKCTEVTWLISHFCSQLWTLRNGCACCQIWFVLHRRPISRQIYRIYLTRSKRLHWIHHNSPLACQLVISLSSACHQLVISSSLSPAEPGWALRGVEGVEGVERVEGVEGLSDSKPGHGGARRLSFDAVDTVRTPYGHRTDTVDASMPIRSVPGWKVRGQSRRVPMKSRSVVKLWEYVRILNIIQHQPTIYEYLWLFDTICAFVLRCFWVFMILIGLNWSAGLCRSNQVEGISLDCVGRRVYPLPAGLEKM